MDGYSVICTFSSFLVSFTAFWSGHVRIVLHPVVYHPVRLHPGEGGSTEEREGKITTTRMIFSLSDKGEMTNSEGHARMLPNHGPIQPLIHLNVECTWFQPERYWRTRTFTFTSLINPGPAYRPHIPSVQHRASDDIPSLGEDTRHGRPTAELVSYLFLSTPQLVRARISRRIR
jgi:hypothetical protein